IIAIQPKSGDGIEECHAKARSRKEMHARSHLPNRRMACPAHVRLLCASAPLRDTRFPDLNSVVAKSRNYCANAVGGFPRVAAGNTEYERRAAIEVRGEHGENALGRVAVAAGDDLNLAR